MSVVNERAPFLPTDNDDDAILSGNIGRIKQRERKREMSSKQGKGTIREEEKEECLFIVQLIARTA